MSQRQPQAQQPQPQQAVGQAEGQQKSLFTTVLQSVALFVLIQYLIKTFISGNNAGSQLPGADKPAAASVVHDSSTSSLAIPQHISPIWPAGAELDLNAYVSPSWVMPSLKSVPSDSLVIDERGFKFGDHSEKREVHTSFGVPSSVRNNGSLWMHFYVGRAGAELDPTAAGYDAGQAYHFVRPLSHYLPLRKKAKKRNLLAGKNQTVVATGAGADEAEKASGPAWASYYHSNFTLSFIPDAGTIGWPTYHPALRQYVILKPADGRDASTNDGASSYYPVLFPNTFWQLRDQMFELNATVEKLPLHIELNNMRHWKFSLYASVDEGMKQNAQKAASGSMPAGGDGSELEELKRILLESNAYLLGTTFIVTILHTIFEFLAFKNDVSHWRSKKDNVGTSFRTILANVAMQAIIFLYLLDNNEHTSWVILFSQGIGIAIEAWKITKTVNVRIRPARPGAMIPYLLTFEDKHQLSESEKKTNEYDEIAFRYLYIVAVPLLAAYAVYSLTYESHKSWYSFVISTLVGSVYAYGFLMMVPSLYINYRLKSVAHMPAKTMTYKFLNTFIDDLFAFTIKMPTLHRLATLRDDVIFFIYLYQSYKYRVDYSRVNEFGQGGEEDEKEKKKDEGKEKDVGKDGNGASEALPDSRESLRSEEITDRSSATASATASTGQVKRRK